MYAKICKIISNNFLKNGIITLDTQEVFEFGLETIIGKVVTISLLLITGLLLNKPVESVMYYICFKYSRKQAGGYHASTYTKCNSLYLITFIVCILLSNIIIISNFENLTFIIISISVLGSVILLSPINNHNNPILPGYENTFFIKAI